MCMYYHSTIQYKFFIIFRYFQVFLVYSNAIYTTFWQICEYCSICSVLCTKKIRILCEYNTEYLKYFIYLLTLILMAYIYTALLVSRLRTPEQMIHGKMWKTCIVIHDFSHHSTQCSWFVRVQSHEQRNCTLIHVWTKLHIVKFFLLQNL